MNINEFAALKVGDKIECPMNNVSGSVGEVAEVTDTGIRVVWGSRHANETRFYYSVNSTAWMHWSQKDA